MLVDIRDGATFNALRGGLEWGGGICPPTPHILNNARIIIYHI